MGIWNLEREVQIQLLILMYVLCAVYLPCPLIYYGNTLLFLNLFFSCHFSPLKFSKVNLLVKFVKKKKMKGRPNIFPQYFTPSYAPRLFEGLSPLEKYLASVCPPGEKKLATPLMGSHTNDLVCWCHVTSSCWFCPRNCNTLLFNVYLLYDIGKPVGNNWRCYILNKYVQMKNITV